MNDTSYGDIYYDKKNVCMFACMYVCVCTYVRTYACMYVLGGGGGDYESRRLGHKVFT